MDSLWIIGFWTPKKDYYSKSWRVLHSLGHPLMNN